MACEAEYFHKNVENIKNSVRKNFAHIYATLKARELKTLRQLEAIEKQCQDDKELMRKCVQNIAISYENESKLVDNISNYGAIDLEKLNFDSDTFILEDYISPNDDHMYSYKCIDDLIKDEKGDELEAIEEAALKQITSTDNCVCFVNIRSENVSKQFRDIELAQPLNNTSLEPADDDDVKAESEIDSTDSKDEKSDISDSEDSKKINPTDDWLNSIKGQTETEPSQVSDVMEHSTITCS